MSIHVNDFVIQSKVIQSCADDKADSSSSSSSSSSGQISKSEKREIIDECFEKVIEYMERTKNHF